MKHKYQMNLFSIEPEVEKIKNKDGIDKKSIIFNLEKKNFKYDDVYIFENGFVKLRQNTFFSLLDENCNIISKKFLNVNFIFYFSIGFILIKKNDLYSVFKKDGNILHPLLKNKDYIFFTKENQFIVIHQQEKNVYNFNLEEII